MAQRAAGALRLPKKQRVGVIPRHVVPRELYVWASSRATIAARDLPTRCYRFASCCSLLLVCCSLLSPRPSFVVYHAAHKWRYLVVAGGAAEDCLREDAPVDALSVGYACVDVVDNVVCDVRCGGAHR